MNQAASGVVKRGSSANMTISLVVNSEKRDLVADSQQQKPAIVSAAPELSHRLMSGPPPLIGGSRELLLKQRGLGLHITVFKFLSRRRGRTKGDSCLSCQSLSVKGKN